MDKRVYIIGVGMDGATTLTAEARAAIEAAGELIGSERTIGLFRYLHKPYFVSFSSAEIAAHIASGGHVRTAVLMSGDCGFFSGARGLLPLLKGFDVTVIPGVSTPVYLCAKLKMPWTGLYFVSLHGRENAIVRPVRSHERTFFLLGGNIAPANICQRLTDYGMGGFIVHVGENLALENERIITAPARELTGLVAGGLCAVIVENPDFERYIPACIPDGEFIRGKTPMTKAEVRCISVSKLNIEENSICWDIGAGTGSVSVEMALRCGGGRVYAVERDPEAIELIDKNRKKFGCDNIEIVTGDAAEVISSLPAPERVFIGGSGGKLREVAAVVKSKNPNAVTAATAVSLETLNSLTELFAEDCEITQIAVTRTKRAGAHTMLAAENPVFIVKGLLR